MVFVPCPPPGAGVHVTLKGGPPPPVGLIVAEPLQLPKQLAFTTVWLSATEAGCVMLNVAVFTQRVPLFLIVTVYCPAQRLVAPGAFPPLGLHVKLYGDTPPDTFTEAAPLHKPKQVTFVCVGAIVTAGGEVMVTGFNTPVQELALVTSTETVAPAHRPVTEAVPPGPTVKLPPGLNDTV